MQRILSRSWWDGEALSVLAPSVAVMSKQGAVNRSRSEVFLVQGPSGEFVACLITKEQAEKSEMQNIIIRALGSEESVKPDVDDLIADLNQALDKV